eukprot:UN21673
MSIKMECKNRLSLIFPDFSEQIPIYTCAFTNNLLSFLYWTYKLLDFFCSPLICNRQKLLQFFNVILEIHV